MNPKPRSFKERTFTLGVTSGWFWHRSLMYLQSSLARAAVSSKGLTGIKSASDITHMLLRGLTCS